MRRFFRLLLSTLLLAATLATPLAADTLNIRARPIALDPHDRDKTRFGKLIYRSGFVLTADHSEFGGLSGLLVSEDGETMLAVSDRGAWVIGALDHAGPVLTGFGAAEIAPILDGFSRPVRDRYADSESLAPGPEGDVYVGFEGFHRVWRYPLGAKGFSATPRVAYAPAVFGALSRNKGPEAMAALPDGRLAVIAEDFPDANNDLLGWIVTNDGVDSFALQRRGRFNPTDLALGPDGYLYLLERRFTIIGGPGMRIRRFLAEAVTPGALLTGETLIELSAGYSIDNMEGLAVREGPNGEILLYVLSDDNFLALQRTLLLQFELAQAP